MTKGKKGSTQTGKPETAYRPTGYHAHPAWVGGLLTAVLFGGAPEATAQQPDRSGLPELLSRLPSENPDLRQAQALVEAAQARVPPAGALPDPMVTAGLMNLPVGSLSLAREGMSMAVLEVGQRFPAPGVREARTRAADARVSTAEHRRDALALALRVQLAEGYAELLYLDETLAVLEHTRALLAELADVARVRLGEGTGAQTDVVRTQTELARIEERVSSVRASRSRSEAELAALVDGALPLGFVVERPEIWRSLLELPITGEDFVDTVPDRIPGLALPPLSELIEQAQAQHPRVAVAQSSLRVQESERLVAERERRPDISVMLGYGVRSGRDDMWSATVSVPVPVFRARKQEALVRAAGNEVEAARHEIRQEQADLEAQIVTAWSDLARARERFHLVERLVLPQATATVESAMAVFRAGSDGTSFLTVLDALMTLLASETERTRSARDLAVASARLDGAAGTHFFLDSDS